MGKKPINLRFDEELWKQVQSAAEQTHRSATGYLEQAAIEKINKDIKNKEIKAD